MRPTVTNLIKAWLGYNRINVYLKSTIQPTRVYP